MRNHSVHKVYLGLGTNLGDRRGNLRRAIDALAFAGCRITDKSGLYETAPWGFSSENSFYNMAVCIETGLPPELLLELMKGIETDHGRVRGNVGYADRIIDLDILLFDELVFTSDLLSIPHPGIPERKFVLLPLSEIAPDKTHPLLDQTISELAERCSDRSEVRRIGEL